MPVTQTSGNLTTDAFGGGAAAAVPNYIEDVFSTWLYDATGATQSITNGIDLSTKGGLVWIKDRTIAYNNCLFDTERGVNKQLYSNATNAQVTAASSLTNFNTNGFTLGADGSFGYVNNAGSLASWTFRKQPKFFDIVTYTGNGSQTIAHSLASIPGFALYKSTSGTGNWIAICRKSDDTYDLLLLNTTGAKISTFANAAAAGLTSTTFDPSAGGASAVGTQYVAYLFAHNAGGFGLTGTDNVISCGTATVVSNAATVNLGYEPQFVLFKATNTTENWFVVDNMRGFPVSGLDNILNPNLAGAEGTGYYISPTATGFNFTGAPNNTYIYIAIRRGPMKVPTDATKVFTPQIATSSGSASNTVTTNFPVDLTISQLRSGYFAEWFDRLRGDSQSTYVRLRSGNTSAEATGTGGLGFDNNTGYVDNYNWQNIGSGNYVYWNMKRAPSFFDEVCITNGSGGYAVSTAHNLGVTPELIIQKDRSATAAGWGVGAPALLGSNNYLVLNTTAAAANGGVGFWSPTSTMTGNLYYTTGTNGQTGVVYLFATCAGVSKVGTYTGNGTTQTINCGFTGGARFVLIKRTDSTGDWYVYDTARGMTTLTDPYLLLNSTAAETATLGSVTTVSTGFAVNASILAAINTSSATYIFLAIA